MWLLLAFMSAFLLGFYDLFKKQALIGNAVIPVLLLNTFFCSLLLLPLILVSQWAPEWLSEVPKWKIPSGDWVAHGLVIVKSFIVLSSWLCGYYGMKHLPITIVGPINATRPLMVLLGAMLLFGERLNLYQWVGILLGVISFFLLSRSGKNEGIDFRNNRWILLVVISAVMGAVSGLYDKFLMTRYEPLFVQAWYTIYQVGMMAVVLLLLWWPRRAESPFHWRWSILLVSLFLTVADYLYFYAMAEEGAMVSVISMIRRGSVVVSFTFGAMIFREKNLRSKAIDLALILLGLIFLYWGSRG